MNLLTTQGTSRSHLLSPWDFRVDEDVVLKLSSHTKSPSRLTDDSYWQHYKQSYHVWQVVYATGEKDARLLCYNGCISIFARTPDDLAEKYLVD